MDLHAFAAELAAGLPGLWSAEYHHRLAPAQADDLAERLCGPFIPTRTLDRAAVLSDPDRPVGLLVTLHALRSGKHVVLIDSLAASFPSTTGFWPGPAPICLNARWSPPSSPSTTERCAS